MKVWFALAAFVPAISASAAPESDRSAVLAVLAGLASDAAPTRAQAAMQAGALHHPIFVSPLRALLAANGGPLEVRLAAAKALGELGIPPAASDLAALTASLLAAVRDPDTSLAVASVYAVARYPFPEIFTRLAAIESTAGTPEAVKAAIQAALAAPAGDEAQARLASWLALSRKGARDPKNALTPEGRWGVSATDLPRIARDLLDPSGAPDRVAVAKSLALWSAAMEVLPFLERARTEPDPAARRFVIEGLARIDGPKAEALLLASKGDPDTGVRARVAAAMITRMSAERTPELLGWLSHEPDKAVHGRLLEALAKAPIEARIAALEANKEPNDRQVHEGLTLVGTATAPVDLLARWLVRADKPELASAVAKQLEPRSNDDVVPVLANALPASSGVKRARLLEAWAKREDPRIADALIAELAAARATPADLGSLSKQPEAVVRPRVLALLTSKERAVRAQALAASQKYRGDDVVAALDLAIAEDRNDTAAFEALLQQQGSLRTGVLAKLLADDLHAQKRSTIMNALVDVEDPRAAIAVSEAVTKEPELSALAIRVLKNQRERAAVEGLSRIAADTRVVSTDRVLALDLVAQRADHETAVKHLMANARDETLEVKMAARTRLHGLDPDVFPEWDPYGRYPLVAIGAGFGASMLLLLSDIADAKLSPAFTAGAGLVLGAATPYLLTLGEDVTLGDAAYFGTTSGWGTAGGWGLAGAFGLDAQETRWLTIAGEAVGVSLGALTMSSAEWGLSDALLANTTAFEVALTASMIQGLVGDGEHQADAAMIAGAITSVPMAFLARRLEVRGDLDVLFAMMGHGAWLGAFAPTMFGSTDGDAAAGAAIGQGFGYLGGLAMAHAFDIEGGDLLLSFVGSALGAATLGGLGLSIDEASPAARAGLVEAGSIAGVLALGLLADRLEIKGNDAWIITLGGLLGATAGARLDVRAATNDFDSRTLAGNTLLGLGLGIGTGIALSQLVDASDAQLVRTLSGGAVLAVAGFGLGRAIDGTSPSTRGLFTGSALAAGMLLTAPFAEDLRLDGAAIGFASITGVSLAAWGSQVPLLVDPQSIADRQWGAAAAGSSIGFASGIALAQVVPVEASDLAFVGVGSLIGSAAGLSLRMFAPDLSTQGRAIAFSGLGALGLIGATALAASRDGGPLLHPEDALKSGAFLGAHGAILGGLLGPVRYPGTTPIGDPIGGGVLLGAAVGLTSGILASELFDLRLDGDVMLESTLFAGAAYGLGGGLGLLAGDRQVTGGVMEGAGLVALIGGMILAPHTSYDDGDLALTTSLTLLGAWHGGWLGSLDVDATGENRGGGVMLGASLGMISGLALSPLVTMDPYDVVEAAFIAQAASALGGGLAWSIRGSSSEAQIVTMELSGAAGLLAGSFIAAHTELTPEDRGLLTFTTALGAAQGARAQPMWNNDGDLAAGAFLGAGAGFLGALALTQLTDIAPYDQVELALFAAAGNIIGGGIEVTSSNLTPAGGAAIGTAFGLGALTAGLLLAPLTEYTADDRSLLGLGVAVGAWNGFLLGDGSDGAAMIGTGAGLLGAMALSQAIDMSRPDQLEAALLMSAGNAIGAGLAWSLEGSGSREVSALASGFGLAAFGGAMIAAPFTTYAPSDYGLMALGAGLGTWHGAWMAHAFGDNSAETRSGGATLLGAGTGVLLGTVLAGLTDISADQQLEAMAMWSYGSAIGGGLALGMGDAGSDRVRTAMMVEAGGIAGLAGAAALANSTSFNAADGFLVGALGVAGAWHGSTFPILTGKDASAEARGGGALLGAGLFALGGHLVSQITDYDGYDVGEIIGAGLAGNAMGFGLGFLVNGADDRAKIALIDGFGLASMGAMMALAPSIHIDRDTWIDAALFSTFGTVLGAVLPASYAPQNTGASAEAIGGGAVLGASLGLGASILLGQTLELDGGNRQSIAFGASAGALTGAGLGLALSTDDRLSAGLFEGLALLGATAVGLTQDRVDLSAGDIGLGALWTGYLTWHQLGITLLTGGTDRQAAGLTMTTAGIGALSAMYLAPKLHLKGQDVLMLFAGSVWGSWIGGWTGRIVDRGRSLEGQDSTGTLLLASVLGSDVGVGATAMVLSGLFDVEPTRFAVINLAGLGGMMIGMLTAGFVQAEPFEEGNVIGSLSGLALGALITSFIDFGGSDSPYETAASEPLTPSGHAAPFSVSEWFPTAKVEPTPDGTGERYMIGVTGLWD